MLVTDVCVGHLLLVFAFGFVLGLVIDVVVGHWCWSVMMVLVIGVGVGH